MPEILNSVFYGNSLEDWGISLIIIVSALILNKLIVLLSRSIFRKAEEKESRKHTVVLLRSIVSPILLGIMLLAIWIAATRLHWKVQIYKDISKSYHLLIVLNFTWLIVRLVTALLDEQTRRRAEKNKAANLPADNNLIPLIKKIVVVFIWAMGVVTALNNAGINVSALLTAMGIGGIAVALAAQDTVKNVIGGITLFADRPFKIGDTIHFDSINGSVEDIGIRSTKIRTFDKRIITIPNSKIVDAAIENISGEPHRRVVMNLGLTYNTPAEKMEEAITILKSIPQTVKEVENKELSAVFSSFEASALVINYIYFIRKSAPDIVEVMSKVNFEILRRFNQAGLNFAFPTQTVHVEKE